MQTFFVIFLLIFVQCTQAQVKPVSKVFNKVDVSPECIGGFRKFLEKNLTFPGNADGDYHCTNYIIDFVVNKNGTIGNIGISKDSPCKNTPYDKLFIDLIKKSSGKWKAGILKGKAVNCWHSQSITICLAGDD